MSLKSHKNNGYFAQRRFDIWQYLVEFFLEWEMFQIRFVDKIKTHILSSLTLLRKSYLLWDNVQKHGGAREAADDNVAANYILRIHKYYKLLYVIQSPRRPGAPGFINPRYIALHDLMSVTNKLEGDGRKKGWSNCRNSQCISFDWKKSNIKLAVTIVGTLPEIRSETLETEAVSFNIACWSHGVESRYEA